MTKQAVNSINSKVYYVCSLWHEDYDTFATVVATSEDRCQAVVDRIHSEAYTDMDNAVECDYCEDNYCECPHDGTICECHAVDDICETGVTPEHVSWLLQHTLGPSQYEQENQLHELEEQGYVVV